MDEIKSVISQLPPQDVTILKALYNPDAARGDLTDNGQRLIPIIDGLSAEEQQDVVNVTAEELPQPDQGDINVELSETSINDTPEIEEGDEEKINPAGNLEDFLI